MEANTYNIITWEAETRGSQFRPSLGYIVSFRIAWAIYQNLISKNNHKNTETEIVNVCKCKIVFVTYFSQK
jgi:hypothetical protein